MAKLYTIIITNVIFKNFLFFRKVNYLICILFLTCHFSELNKNQSNPELKFGGTEPAFEFPQNTQWINTSSPISLKDLKGKIVLLYFWKYSSINCIHALVDIKKLEKKWKNELVIIGIHTPKFSAEKNKENLRQAILRNEIEHPIINDIDFTIWRQYQISSWPTFVLIDPKGMVVGVQSGESIYEGFDKILSGMVEEFNSYRLISITPNKSISLENKKITNHTLSFPGKLILNETGTELFVSDTNHHRILRIDTQTRKILDTIGNGKPGFKDGNFSGAMFQRPMGLTLKDDYLYIADSENHAIREANLKTKRVKTLAGTGEQAKSYNVSGKGKEVSFNSPWDLIESKNILYITMRGSHQIWTVDLKTLEADVFAGSGSENLFDGKLEEASFAQPSGITKDRVKFYLTDSETSSVRSIDFKSSESINTVIGRGLFEFGDLDHSYPQARLQYPTGIAYSNGKLYVADTFNHKIKLIDPYEKTSITLAGTGKIGAQNGKLLEASFFEPSGIAVFKSKVYVADTNNHTIRVIDLDSKMVSNFEILE